MSPMVDKKPALGTSIQFTAADGRVLTGTYFAPLGTLKRGLVLAGAMGVKQGFYAKFAHALSLRGIAVLTFGVHRRAQCRLCLFFFRCAHVFTRIF